MARIHEEAIVLKLSQLVKDDADVIEHDLAPEMLAAIEEVVCSFMGASLVVEAFKA